MTQQIRTCRIEPERWPDIHSELCDGAIRWVRLGDELALFSTDEASMQRVVGTSAQPDAKISGNTWTTREEDLYIVNQKGRLFEKDHHDVKVLINKGRFLLVELTDDQASVIRNRNEPCYAVRRFEPDSVVFDSPGLPASRSVSPEWVTALASSVEESSFRDFAEMLVSFRTRFSTSALYVEAAQWCKSKFEEFGYESRLVPVPVLGSESLNVIADRVGSGPAERKQVLLTAHLDSTNGPGGPTADAPGADDNASGSAGVIELARVLKNHPNVNDFRLILFGGEEQGLVGSRHYVAELSTEQRDRIKSVVNMDMIGNQNTLTPSVLLEGGEASREIIRDLQDAAANHTSLEVQTSFDPKNSDHESFTDEDIPAVLTIEGADGSNTDVHTSRDTFDKLDIGLAVEILRMNAAFTGLQLGRHV